MIVTANLEAVFSKAHSELTSSGKTEALCNAGNISALFFNLTTNTLVEKVFFFSCSLGSVKTNRSIKIFLIAVTTQLEMKNDDNVFSKTNEPVLGRQENTEIHTNRTVWQHIITGRWEHQC